MGFPIRRQSASYKHFIEVTVPNSIKIPIEVNNMVWLETVAVTKRQRAYPVHSYKKDRDDLFIRERQAVMNEVVNTCGLKEY